MSFAALWLLVRRDLTRARGALFSSAFGITAGTAALVFFLALGLGVRAVLLGEVFPLDKVELEPRKGADPGLFGLLLGAAPPPGIEADSIAALGALDEVDKVYPKLKLALPASARGGKELIGRDVGTSELFGDGVDPSLVADELTEPRLFRDPLETKGKTCVNDDGCDAPSYCERTSGASEGVCSEPVPALVSRYLIEIFDKTIAPAHNLPPVGATLVARGSGITFNVRLGEALLGKAKQGEPRTVRVRVVGVSRRAMDLGLTFPRAVVERWNREFAGEEAARRASSVVLQIRENDDASAVIAKGASLGLEPTDTRARDVSVLVSGTTALLSLIAAVLLIVSATNIAYTFRVLVSERTGEIALYRALGATGADMRRWMMGLSLVVGLGGGALGVIVARLAALGADYLAAEKLPDFPFKPETFFDFPASLYLAGAAFGALFALLGALGPSRRAARVEPAMALASV